MQTRRTPGAVSHISQAYPDRVEVRGRDLSADVMGRLSFTEYFHLLLTGREPTEDQRFFLDLLLVAIAEHGMMPTNVAARMTLAADPGSLQGAVGGGMGQAADDERVDADRGRDPRPGVPVRRRQGRPDPRAHGRPARTSRRGAAASAGLRDGGGGRGGDRVRARAAGRPLTVLAPEVETRPWAEQLALDDASYL